MAERRKSNKKINAFLRGLVFWPVAGLLSVMGIRFAFISNPGRIGHMAAEVDAFLKETRLELIPRTRAILLINRDRSANRALLDVYRQYLTVWDHPLVYRPLAELARIETLRLPLGRPVIGLGESARYQEINWLWGDRPPAVTLPPDLEEKGRDCARSMGLPDDAWFVTVHAREGGYSPSDEGDHAHRNASIGAYSRAFDAVREAGGWIVRVGDPTMTPLEPSDGLIDYATSRHKSEWMDLWLMSHTRFLIGTSSGLAMLATMFGKPCALVNMVPAGASLGMGPNDISIPKRMLIDGAEVTIPDAFDQNMASIRYAWVFAERGITVVENTDDEIRALTQEMLDRLDGTFEVTPDDEDLQRRYKSCLRPIDYSYGAPGRIGRDWLRENRHLLGD